MRHERLTRRPGRSSPPHCAPEGDRPTSFDHLSMLLSSALTEQLCEAPLAGAGEIHDTAAGGRIAGCPFQFREALHHRRAKRTGQVMAPLAPVEAGLAERPARMRDHIERNLQMLRQEFLALSRKLDLLLLLPYQTAAA